ncbi:MAG: response regulator [Flavobacterium circumlabens]|uniref:CheY-like chemotaxis protein n=1 Tax=Flavobacterium circumlabens TaxID=2133765 RepID=A0A4Y7U778_9FLAO|nr:MULTISPECIES: response regulator [Flavobacterium]QSB26391.1 response regulator [Flavobacterium sp. CLA17]TCN51123.1 CheY-like chemotaxis protein [Flavobacterium circumlabens]TEB41938.1 response regulator [Flavobacterium circumlabens]
MELKPVFLLIEDNLIDQLVIKQLLTKMLDVTETEVNITNNGVEALQWLSTHQNLQQLIILLDIQMPVMNGFEFLNAYDKLNNEFKKVIQIYVLSSTLDQDEIQKINENNYVTGFLNKPLPIEELKKTIYLNT